MALRARPESRQAFNDKTWQNASGRITAQVTPRNKVNIFWDEQSVCANCENGGNYANAHDVARGQRLRRPARRCGSSRRRGPRRSTTSCCSRAASATSSRAGAVARRRTPTPRTWPASSSSAPDGVRRPTADIPGLMYRSQTTDLFSDGRNKNITTTWRAIGRVRHRRQQLQVRLHRQQARRPPLGQPQRERPSLPHQQRRGESVDAVHPRPAERSVDAQRRLLCAAAVDARPPDAAGRAAIRSRVELGAAAAGSSRASGRSRSCSRRRRWWTATRISRRACAVTYDLFGNGKTALKATLGKYLESTVTASNYGTRQPDVANRHQRVHGPGPTATPTGTLTATSQSKRAGLRANRGDFCGVINNLNFGTSTFSNTIDPDILHGLGRTAVGLELGRVGAARSAAAHVGRDRLLPSRVLRLRGDRQPGGEPIGLHAVLGSRAARSAPAQWRRLSGGHALRPEQPGAVRA